MALPDIIVWWVVVAGALVWGVWRACRWAVAHMGAWVGGWGGEGWGDRWVLSPGRAVGTWVSSWVRVPAIAGALPAVVRAPIARSLESWLGRVERCSLLERGQLQPWVAGVRRWGELPPLQEDPSPAVLEEGRAGE